MRAGEPGSPDDDVIVLWSSAALDKTFASLLSMVGPICVAFGARSSMTVLLVVGGLALVGAAIMWSRYLFRTPQSATLSRHGLRILHGEETIGEVPGAAIREFILAETTGGVFELRMRYDQEAVPQLPPAVRKFCERCGMQSEEILRAIGRPLSPSTIPLGAVGGSRFTPLTMEKVFRIRRLVESTGMAEWHRISDQ